MMSAPSTRTYRLMTWNIHRCVGLDRRHSPERIAHVIRDFDADVVALQEVEVNHRRTGRIHQPSHLAGLLKMDYHYHPPRILGESGFGNAILTRLNMRPVRSGILPTLPRMQRRGAMWASFDVGGQHLQLINTHFGLRSRERMLQVNDLCGDGWLDHPDCRQRPRIVCGDFNAVPGSKVYRQLDTTLRDAQHLGGDPMARTWPSFLPMLRYDHVFVDGGIKVRKVSIPKTLRTLLASDHLPVMMEFEVPATAHGHSHVPATRTFQDLGNAGWIR